MKYNSNYIKNKRRIGHIRKIVEDMINEKVIKQPYDYLFRRNGEFYPYGYHITLDLPGTFKSTESTNLFTEDGKALRQDYVERVGPDDKYLTEDSIIGVEHLSGVLSQDKSIKLYNYKTTSTGKYNLPCILILVTKINYYTDELIIKFNNDTFSVKVIYISPEKIEKILNTSENKNYLIEEVSEVDFLNLVHCLVFAPDKKQKSVIKRVANIFVSMENINESYHLDLHYALKTMIKYHFKDEKDQRELLTMITQSMTQDELDKLPTLEFRAKKIEQLEIELSEMDQTIAEKDQEIKMLKEQLLFTNNK